MAGFAILCLMSVSGATFISAVMTMKEGNVATVRGIHVLKTIGIALLFWLPLVFALAHIEVGR